jgi:hypothetical protein
MNLNKSNSLKKLKPNNTDSVNLFNKADWKNCLFWTFIILYTALLLYTAQKINISEDETYTLNTTSRNLQGVINQSYNFEFQLPGYFIFLSFWRLISSGIIFAKLFSILSIGIATIYLYKLSNLFEQKKASLWIVIIFLLNPFSVWAALEIRLYAFAILLSTLIIYTFYLYVFQNRKKALYLFLICALIGVYTQYFFVFLIFVLALTTIFIKGWKYFLKICSYLIPVAILFLPNLMFLPNQLEMQEAHGSSHFDISKIVAVLRSPQSLALAINYVPDAWLNRIIRSLFLFIFIIACFKFYKNNLIEKNLFYKNYKTILLCIFLLVFLFALGVYVTDIVFTTKYMVVTYPFFILLLLIFESYPRIYKNLIYGIICIYFLIILIPFYRHPVNTYDFKSIAKFVEKIEQSDQPILMYRSNIALPFEYYYKGKNKIIPLPRPVNFDANYLTNIKDTNQLKQLLYSITPPPTSYLLISDTTQFETTLNMHRDMVSDYISKKFRVTLDTLYEGNAKGKAFRIRTFELQ